MTIVQVARPERILVVDDDPGIREVVCEFLEQQGYSVESAADGQEMERALARSGADVVVLDVMLPGEDGLSLCRKLARADGPAIIMLSAMGEETDRIVGLELGADDYVPKPCNPHELLARVRAVLRRRRGRRADDDLAAPDEFEFAGWRLAPVRHELRAPDGALVELPSGQFSLLRVFLERPQRILSRAQLMVLAGVLDSDSSDRAIDVRISRLRLRLYASANGVEMIRTVRGEGYMFVPKVLRHS